MFNRTVAIIVTGLAALLWAGDAHGAFDTWKTPVTNWFDSGLSWTDGSAPGPNDTVGFDKAGTYLVCWDNLTGNRTTRDVTFSSGNVNFVVMNGGTYSWAITDPSPSVYSKLTVSGGAMMLGLSGYGGSLTLNVEDMLDISGVLNVALGYRVTAAGSAQIASTASGAISISGGGTVSNSTAYIGYSSGMTGNVSVSGAGSQWSCSSTLEVGRQGAGTLTVSNGAQGTSSDCNIGNSSGGTGTMTVTGAGSRWTNANGLLVGNLGGGSLTVSAGAQIVNRYSYIGNSAGATGGATVTGTGSTWSNSSELYVGRYGQGTLSIQAGGQVSSYAGYLGYDSSSTGNATVDGAGSMWTITSSWLFVGLSGNANLSISNGGQVHGLLSYVGGNAGSTGSLAVDGAGSLLSCSSALSVGYSGTGSLTLTSGGQAVSVGGNVGPLTGSSGVVMLDGTGSKWTVSGALYVGGSDSAAGGTGAIWIGAGSEADVSGSLKLWANGTLNLTGGTVRFHGANPIVFGGGAFNFYAGAVAYAGDINVGAGLSQVTTLFGAVPVVPSGKGLTIEGKATLLTPMALTGGTLSVGSLVNAPLLQFNSGTLNLTASDLTVGAGGTFGSSLVLPAGKAISVTQTITVGSSGLVDLQGGSLSADVVNNQGTILLESPIGGLTAGTLANSGLVRGTGRIDGALSNQASGQIRAGAGEDLMFIGTDSHTNAGLLEAVGGQMEFVAPLTNQSSTGMIAGENATFRFTGGLTNHGAVAMSFGTSRVFGDVVNSASGSIVVSGGSEATFYGDLQNNGLVRVSAGGKAVFFGAYSGNGVSGTGAVYLEGDLRPGHSPASISFGGDLYLGSGSATTMELGGSSPGSQYDQVAIGGALGLGGTLNVVLIDGFTPSPGDTFNLFDGSLGGTFAAVNLPELPSTMKWDTSGLYTSGVIGAWLKGDFNHDSIVTATDIDLLVANSGAHPFYDLTGDQLVTRADMDMLIKGILHTSYGDANLDRYVDFLDFQTLLDNWQLDAAWATGDWTGDGTCDFLDFQVLLDYWNPVGETSSSIPEPATLVLLTCGWLAAMRSKRAVRR